MYEHLGTLGNIELYFVFPDRNKTHFDVIENGLSLKDKEVFKNTWAGTSFKKIDFSDKLFTEPIDADEILIQCFFRKNMISTILLNDRMILRISFKPWDALEPNFEIITPYLLKESTFIVIGIEIDLEYNSDDLNEALKSLINNTAYYPLVIRNADNSIDTYHDENSLFYDDSLRLLNDIAYSLFK
jgi:hypothetical protein